MKKFSRCIAVQLITALLIVSLLSSCAVSANVRMEDGVMGITPVTAARAFVIPNEPSTNVGYSHLTGDYYYNGISAQNAIYENPLTDVNITEHGAVTDGAAAGGGLVLYSVGYIIGIGLGILVLVGIGALIGLMRS